MDLQFALVEIVVEDMARSLTFYRHLGLPIPTDADSQPHVDVELGGARVAFDTQETIRSFLPDWQPPQGGHRMGLAFQASTPSAVDEAYAELVAAGGHGEKEPWDAFWGMRYAIVHDPDGNPVDLFCPLS